MNIKKILNILIFLGILLNTICVSCCYAESELDRKKRENRANIKRVEWLKNVESNKLYKNQQRLESATTSLKQSQSEVVVAEKELQGMQSKLDKAAAEYDSLNAILAIHIRKVFKTQRKALFELFINSEDINMLVDRIYFQKVILKDDYDRMVVAKSKAREIALLKYGIESKKRNLERSIASISTQQDYIRRAIKKNESMIDKLNHDKNTYMRAERELAKQSEQIGSYISKTTKHTDTKMASGFIKPIQGRITSPYGWRTHPIFNTRSFHSGVDIGGPNLGAIRASNSGKVIYVGWYGGYGKVVIIEHGSNSNGKPISTLYAHMSSTAVSKEQKVTKGQVIGYEGTTGYSTGPHCHFEVRVNGQTNNPLNYI